MIFLFFGPSLALLEAELAPFKDWAKSSSSSLLDHPHNAAIKINDYDDDCLCLCLCIHQKSESEVMIFNPKSITDFNQFEGTIWANATWWKKFVKNVTLVRRKY